jgi:hypothetical protein
MDICRAKMKRMDPRGEVQVVCCSAHVPRRLRFLGPATWTWTPTTSPLFWSDGSPKATRPRRTTTHTHTGDPQGTADRPPKDSTETVISHKALPQGIVPVIGLCPLPPRFVNQISLLPWSQRLEHSSQNRPPSSCTPATMTAFSRACASYPLCYSLTQPGPRAQQPLCPSSLASARVIAELPCAVCATAQRLQNGWRLPQWGWARYVAIRILSLRCPISHPSMHPATSQRVHRRLSHSG